MTIKILISPPATGKTEQCIQRIQDALREHPMGPVWVVVPDRLQAYAFRRRLAADGGAIGAHVGNFGDLYQEILRRAAKSVPVASEPVGHRLLRSAIHQVKAAGGLEYYAPIAEKPGFLRVVEGVIAELKLARVWPEVFHEASLDYGVKQIELARIYAAYQEIIGKIGWADQEGVNWLATEALEMEPDLMRDLLLLIVDGFDSFNGAQRAAIRLLGERVPDLLITLPGTQDSERTAHRRFTRSLQKLAAEMPVEVEHLPNNPYLHPPLANLESNLFQPEPRAQSTQNRIIQLEVRSQPEEAREALRWLKARILRDDFSPFECALIVPNLEKYRPYLREAGDEFGLPLRFTKGEPLASAPPIAALLALLDLTLKNFPRRLTLEAVRTPYFDLSQFNFFHDDAISLEAVSLHGQVIEGLDQWEDALLALASAEPTPESDEDAAGGGSALPCGEEAARLWSGLKTFADRLMYSGLQTTGEWVRWLEDLLEDLQFLRDRETPRDEAAFLGLRETLRALVVGELITEEEAIDSRHFVTNLKGVLEATGYQERVRWKEPAIQVLGVLESRGLRYRAVAVVGLAEGVFPEIEREDPFLPEELREVLGLEPRLGREQGGLFYQAATRADENLLLTRPYLAEDGERWESSPFWIASSVLIEESPVVVRPELPRSIQDAGSSQEALFWAVRRQGLPKEFEGVLLPRWQHLRISRDILQARLEREPAGPFDGDLCNLAISLEERYGAEHTWSPSRLETYGTCPHRFFVQNALDLEVREPPEPGYDARQLGTMLHIILEEAYRQAEKPADPESVIDALEHVAEEVFAGAPERFGFRPTALWEVDQEHMLSDLKETVLAIAELGEGWIPMAYERVFGLEGSPSLSVEVEGGFVQVRGVVDRLDEDDEGRLRVIDYKTGSSHLSPRDLIEGRRLQLPLYAMAASQALDLGKPAEGLYWIIRSAKAGSLRLSKFRGEVEGETFAGLEGAFKLTQQHVSRIVMGVRSGSFLPVPPRGGCPSYCPAVAWCWRYVASGW